MAAEVKRTERQGLDMLKAHVAADAANAEALGKVIGRTARPGGRQWRAWRPALLFGSVTVSIHAMNDVPTELAERLEAVVESVCEALAEQVEEEVGGADRDRSTDMFRGPLPRPDSGGGVEPRPGDQGVDT